MDRLRNRNNTNKSKQTENKAEQFNLNTPILQPLIITDAIESPRQLSAPDSPKIIFEQPKVAVIKKNTKVSDTTKQVNL